MKKSFWSVSGFAALFLFAGGQAHGQQVQLPIDDSGAVAAAHQHHHAKNGHKISWVRQTGAAKTWSVTFTASPCAEGTTFGSAGPTTCTIKVRCSAAGDAGCKAYPYSSSAGGAAQDPDIIVDP